MQKKIEKAPWPTKKAMQQVYALNFWGTNNTSFYSGEGSHSPEIVVPYIVALRTFFKTFNQDISVCDLGCGDFNIGKQLVDYTNQYYAIDVVPELIEFNNERFKFGHLNFLSLDISIDEIPSADCVIIRQVLQHLSNVEILNIVNKLKRYKYIILTEHIPSGSFTPNIDIISGQGTRLKKNSGVDIASNPFNFEFQDSKILHQIDLGVKKGTIKTILYTT